MAITAATLTYVRDHWRGEHSLAWSFGINLVLFRLIIFAAEIILQGILDHTEFLFVAAKTVFFIIFHVIVLGWQIIGTVRAAESHMQSTGSSIFLWATYLVCFAAMIMTANVVLSTNKPVQSYDFLRTMADIQADNRKAQYQLRFDSENQTLHFSGLFVIGVRKAFERQLQTEPKITHVVLSSPGGSIYEARGVARLLLAHRITTHVSSSCASACVLAYLAGDRRTISQSGQLGFHKYGFNFANKQPHPMINLADEHRADRQFMKARGLADRFLEKVFAQEHSDIWFPPTHELLEAGAAHAAVQTAR